MQPVDQTRRERLAQLIKDAGSQAALSEIIGKAPAQISQWVNASVNSKTGKPRMMSNDVAREIEKKTSKPAGWMDQLGGDSSTGPIGMSATPWKLPLGQMLEQIDNATKSVAPVLQAPCRAALMRWAIGEATIAETTATIDAFVKASEGLPPPPSAMGSAMETVDFAGKPKAGDATTSPPAVTAQDFVKR